MHSLMVIHADAKRINVCQYIKVSPKLVVQAVRLSDISYIGFKFLFRRSTIHARRFSLPASVFASKYARAYVFFTEGGIASKFI